MTEEHEDQKPTPQRTLVLLDYCINGLKFTIDAASRASAVNATYAYLEAEEGRDYRLHQENFMFAKYIMEQFHEILDSLDKSGKHKKRREESMREASLLDFVCEELEKGLIMLESLRNKYGLTLSKLEALSQVNLDEDGFRLKFAVESEVSDHMTFSDSITEKFEAV